MSRRASPRVYYFLLGKSCVLPTPKTKYQMKKRDYFQEFAILDLP
jgi:hypothetical protein